MDKLQKAQSRHNWDGSSLSSEHKLLAHRCGVELPFLPIKGPKERMLFKTLTSTRLSAEPVWRNVAIKWLDYGKTVSINVRSRVTLIIIAGVFKAALSTQTSTKTPQTRSNVLLNFLLFIISTLDKILTKPSFVKRTCRYNEPSRPLTTRPPSLGAGRAQQNRRKRTVILMVNKGGRPKGTPRHCKVHTSCHLCKLLKCLLELLTSWLNPRGS